MLTKLLKLRFLRRLFYVKLLGSLLVNANRILDVGCGIGEFVKVASDTRKLVIGVDLDLKFLQKAEQQCSAYAVYVLADKFHLSFCPRSFDAFFACNRACDSFRGSFSIKDF